MKSLTWPETKTILLGILQRQWYTGHGPLQQQLETELEEIYGGSHCITVTNVAIAIKLLSKIPNREKYDALIFNINDIVAYITTADDDLADKLRTLRSSKGVRRKMKVPYVGYGRVSEIQAGLALATIKKYGEVT